MSDAKTSSAAENQSSEEDYSSARVTACSQILTAWNGELSRFYTQRLSEYWRFPQQAMTCITPTEYLELQSDFYGTLMSDYRQEAKRLAGVLDIAHDMATSENSDYNAGLLKAQKDAAAIIDQAHAQAEKILESAMQGAKEETDSKKKVA